MLSTWSWRMDAWIRAASDPCRPVMANAWLWLWRGILIDGQDWWKICTKVRLSQVSLSSANGDLHGCFDFKGPWSLTYRVNAWLATVLPHSVRPGDLDRWSARGFRSSGQAVCTMTAASRTPSWGNMRSPSESQQLENKCTYCVKLCTVALLVCWSADRAKVQGLGPGKK